MKEKKEKFVRINSRITVNQDKFVKDYAEKHELTEGEVYRLIIQTFITSPQ